ncbi:LysR family transcriptional regulator [Cellulomonas sp. T2.31MG-18]|uniref:LysR family transcriptional regulator n=1 Tax=Cellulomonas sp. T2.31MG-18 TaxID=3157619 RepID=UPI00366B14FA
MGRPGGRGAAAATAREPSVREASGREGAVRERAVREAVRQGVVPEPIDADGVDGVGALAGLDVGGLRLLQAIAEHGTLTAAAAVLGTSQPAVSQHVRRLERRLGTALLDRSGRRVRLTEAGAVLAAHGQTVNAAVRAAAAQVTALTGLRAGVVRVVAFPSSSATLVPLALARLRREHPGLTVTLDEAEPPEALARLRAGTCDVAVTFAYGSAGSTATPGLAPRPDAAADAARDGELSGLVARHLLDDPTLAVLPADHPRADDPQLSLSDLAGETWIAGCPQCRGHLLHSAAACGFAPEIAYATDDYVAVLSLVAAGLGVALLPRLVRQTGERHPGVVLRSAAGTSARRVYAMTTPDLIRVPAVAATLDALAAAAPATTAAVSG